MVLIWIIFLRGIVMSPFEQLMNEYLKEEETAKLLGLSIKTLRNRRYSRKDHPPFIKVSNEVLYPVDKLKQWLKDKEVRQINKAS